MGTKTNCTKYSHEQSIPTMRSMSTSLTLLLCLVVATSSLVHARQLQDTEVVNGMVNNTEIDTHAREDASDVTTQRSGGAAPSAFCMDLNKQGTIQAKNVKFADDCRSYIAVNSKGKSPCALFMEAMTGSNVQTTYNLTLAFTDPPMSMKIVIDDGPSDTSITRTGAMWSVEAVFDT